MELVFRKSSHFPDINLRSLRPWYEALIHHLAPEGESLGVLFTSNRTMARYNGSFRQLNVPTDVLSFPANHQHLGDIVLCVPRARIQAQEKGHSVEKETKILLLHGLLHCLNYDHETDNGEMDAFEAELRSQWV